MYILIKLFAVFFASYLIAATLFWGYQRIEYYHRVSKNLTLFAEEEHASLVKNVFDTAITKAKLCVSLPEAEKKQCQDEIRLFIATELHEEILGQGLISDSLHFVKREEDTLYTLNWEGKLSISQVGDTYTQLNGYYHDAEPAKYREYDVKLPPSNNNPLRYFNVFSQRCKYFDLYDYNSCQVAVSIQLEDDSEGYVVSMMVLTEEDMWWMYAALSPLIWFQMIMINPGELFSAEIWPFGLVSISLLIIPSVTTYLYWRKYHKTSSKK